MTSDVVNFINGIRCPDINMLQQPKQGFLLAFGELFLKSEGVQRVLKRNLANHLNFFLKKEKADFRLHQFRERFFIETKELEKTIKILQNTFGLVWFAQTFFLPRLKNSLAPGLPEAGLKELSQFVKNNYFHWLKEKQTFALRVRKSGEIKESREEIIKEIAGRIKRKVALEKPDKEIFLEVRKAGWFLYFEKQECPGGLPFGSQGRAMVLMSGGLDSPVAAYLMAKRGAENVWLHFHSFPLVSRKSIEKVKELAKVFANFQPKLKVYYLPFSQIQLQIKTNTPAKYRVLLYRRIMLKIAQKLAQKENCQALVTGESLGQVSSQTMTNLTIIEEGIKIPVLRPVIGLDKEEIIAWARKIKTYEISIKPQEDCCSLFVAKHSTASGRLEIVKKLEKNLKLNKLIQKAIKEKEVIQGPSFFPLPF